MGEIEGADYFFNLGPGLQHIHAFAGKVSLFWVFGALDRVLLSWHSCHKSVNTFENLRVFPLRSMSKPEGSRTGKYTPGCQAKKLSEIVKFIKKCTAMERELDLRIPSFCVCLRPHVAWHRAKAWQNAWLLHFVWLYESIHVHVFKCEKHDIMMYLSYVSYCASHWKKPLTAPR